MSKTIYTQNYCPEIALGDFSLYIDSTIGIYAGDATVYTTAGQADFMCKTLTRLFPTMKICLRWRDVVRAYYVNGERTLLSSAQDVYSNLTDEEIASSLFLDSDTIDSDSPNVI